MSSSLNAISSPLVLEPAPLVARSRSRTVANGDSMMLVVRRVLPVLGGKIEERDQAFPVGGKRLDRLGVLGLILRLETRSCGLAIGAPLGVHHFVQRALGAGLKPLGQLVEHVCELVTPAGLLAGLRPHLAHCGPNPSAPSPTATAGAAIPHRLRSRNSAFQLSALSR